MKINRWVRCAAMLLGASILVSNSAGQVERGPLPWETNYTEAVNKAVSEGKLLFMVAGRPGCAICYDTRNTTVICTNPPLRQLIVEAFIPWYCDMDISQAYLPFATGLSTPYSLPIVCAIDPKTKKSMWRSNGPQSPAGLVTALRKAARSVPPRVDSPKPGQSITQPIAAGSNWENVRATKVLYRVDGRDPYLLATGSNVWTAALGNLTAGDHTLEVYSTFDGGRTSPVAKVDFKFSQPRTIAGQVKLANGSPLAGVTVAAGDVSTVATDGTGHFTITVASTFTGTILPSLDGYTFTPSSVTYPNDSVDFANLLFEGSPVSYELSGRVLRANDAPVKDASITASGSGSAPVTSDASGFFSLQVPYLWSGQLTANHPGYQIAPVAIPAVTKPVNTNLTAVPNLYSISGKIIDQKGQGLAQVTVKSGTFLAITDATGTYTLTSVPYGTSLQLTATLAGYVIAFPAQPNEVTGDVTLATVTAEPIHYTISGSFSTANGQSVTNVTIYYGDTSINTGPNTNYTLTIPFGWTGSIQPSNSVYSFEPTNRTYTNVSGNLTGQDFVAASLGLPEIIQSPSDQVAVVGGGIKMSVTVKGQGPFQYIWRRDANDIISVSSDETNSVLVLTNLDADDNGVYSVCVTNSFGQTTSSGASLKVLEPVKITGQSRDQTVVEGDPVTLTVTATGTDLFYIWYKKMDANSVPIMMQNDFANSLNFASVKQDDAGLYYAEVYSPVDEKTSQTIQLTVEPQQSGSSRLSISRMTNGSVVVSWNPASKGDVLQKNTGLGPAASWGEVLKLEQDDQPAELTLTSEEIGQNTTLFFRVLANTQP